MDPLFRFFVRQDMPHVVSAVCQDRALSEFSDINVEEETDQYRKISIRDEDCEVLDPILNAGCQREDVQEAFDDVLDILDAEGQEPEDPRDLIRLAREFAGDIFDQAVTTVYEPWAAKLEDLGYQRQAQ